MYVCVNACVLYVRNMCLICHVLSVCNNVSRVYVCMYVCVCV